MPFFSVIIPLYNKEKYIAKCLESALAQTFSDFEIIIINDGSDDNGAATVKTFQSDKIKFYEQPNSGVSAARNNAVKFATGKFLAFLDADDYWQPNHLQTLKESIEAFPEAGLYGNNYIICHSENFKSPTKLNFKLGNNPKILENFFEANLLDTAIWTSASAISKEKFMLYGMFNLDYKTGQDLDLWIRVALKEDVVFNPKITMVYNKYVEESLSKNEYNSIRYHFLSSYLKIEENNSSLKKYLDIKRYGLALRTKINSEKKIYKDTLKTIDFNNLSLKQKVLLKMPVFILKLLNKVRPLIIKNRFYLSLFKS